MTVASRAETLDHALAYTARGWRVVPIKPGGKHPPIDEWQKAATNDPSLAADFWTAWPRHGIGIATGQASGIFVLDVDVVDGKQGDETLADLEAEHGPLPDTVECITGSGGRHLYFKYPVGMEVRNDAGRRLGPGLDIRGEGGQVLAPPTTHPNGRPYTWEADHDPMDGVAVAEAPGWLLELLTNSPSGAPRAERTPYTGVPRPGDLYAASVTWPELLQPDGATFLGARTDRHTGSTYELWARPGADHTSATLNYGGTDCLHVFSSSWPGLEEGGTYSKFAYYALTRHGGDFSAAARAVRQTVPEPPPVAAEEAQDEEEGQSLRSRFCIDWGEFWARDHSGEEWFAYPLLPAKRGVALYAPAKSGKSLLMLYIAACKATGRPCLGQPATEPQDVLYLDYEMTEADLYERLEEMGFGPGDEEAMSRFHYSLFPSMAPLDTAAGGQVAVALAVEVGAQAVIIDTFSRVTSREENDNKAAQEFYLHVGGPLKARGIGCYRLDHAGKDLERGQRGGSAKNDDVDVVWQLLPGEDGLRLKRTHARINWAPESVELVRHEDPLAFRYEEAAAHYQPGTKEAAELLDRLGVPLDLGRRKVRTMLKAAGEGMGTALLADAIRWRKASQPAFENVSTALVDTSKADYLDTSGGTTWSTPSEQGGHVGGHVWTHQQSNNGPVSPPIGGHGPLGPAQDSLDYDPDDPESSLI